MTTTISCDEGTKERFDDLRPEGASSADEFLTALLDHYEGSDAAVWETPDPPPDLYEDFEECLEDVRSSTETVEERTGRIERLLEGLTG